MTELVKFNFSRKGLVHAAEVMGGFTWAHVPVRILCDRRKREFTVSKYAEEATPESVTCPRCRAALRGRAER